MKSTIKLIDLLTQTNDYISGQRLAEMLGVSRQAVWKDIKALKDQGFDIKSVTNRGYMLASFPQYLNTHAIKSELNTTVIGSELYVLDSVDSTNDYLKSLGNNGCKNGAVVAAREQVKGKGRLGRAWQSTRDKNITFSFLLRPHITPYEASGITPIAGLAVCKSLREFTGLDCKIKWPNDIIIGKKKLCGILTEMSAEFDAVEYIVVGIGLNVNQTEFPEDIAFKTTSLALETKRSFNQNKLLAVILEELEHVFSKTNLRLTNDALNDYISLCVTIGKSVSFQRGNSHVTGIAADISTHGELMVMMPDGTICSVNAGEVTVQGIY